MGWVQQEQAALIATFRTTDPDASTLCEGWNVRRLLAHLTQRGHKPIASITDAISRKPPGQEPGLNKLTSRAKTPEGYEGLIRQFGKSAPRWSPMSWAAEQINLIEYVVHHEDIRRAGEKPAEPRDLPEAEQQVLWKQLGMMIRFGVRKPPVGLRLVTPVGSRVVKDGNGVTLSGDPVEMALWVTGRRRAARVEVTGSPEALDAFQAWATAS